MPCATCGECDDGDDGGGDDDDDDDDDDVDDDTICGRIIMGVWWACPL